MILVELECLKTGKGFVGVELLEAGSKISFCEYLFVYIVSYVLDIVGQESCIIQFTYQ